jgi:hypothetical protein
MKRTPLEGELKKKFVAYERSDVTPTMAIRSATVNMEVKWRLNPRKTTEFAHGRFFKQFLLKTPLNSARRYSGM